MSSIGTGYDYSATTYSPDGRIYQVEYAEKAVENSGTVVAIQCRDGVVIGVQKLLVSKMLEPSSNRRIQILEKHVGMVGAGLGPDARQLANRARQEAQHYKSTYGTAISGKMLSERLSLFVHQYTLWNPVRPFGVTTMIAAMDRDGPQLFFVDPAGNSFGYTACAVGKGRQSAKNELEKLKTAAATMSMRDALGHVARILVKCHDESKDKDVEFEFGWVGTETNNKFDFVRDDLRDEVLTRARHELDEDDEDEDE
jgi:20S proteasome subunit alpha 7